MRGLELKIPPVLVFLVAIAGVYYSPRQPNFYEHIADYTRIIGTCVFGVGVLVGLLAVLSFNQHKTSVHPMELDKASRLVTGGIFKFTRNPMYLGLSMGVLGAGIFVQSHWLMTLLFVFFFTAFITRFQIVPEERKLLELFGNEYTEYMNQTRRWI